MLGIKDREIQLDTPGQRETTRLRDKQGQRDSQRQWDTYLQRQNEQEKVHLNERESGCEIEREGVERERYVKSESFVIHSFSH